MKRVVIFAALGLVVIAGLFFVKSHRASAPSKNSVSGCVTLRYATGASGSCVRDIQTMVNFLETNGMTECPFIGAQALPVDGTYNAATATQVKTVQDWANCYEKEEGGTANLTADGVVDKATWAFLCTYAYKYPSQAGKGVSSFYDASVAAGKEAGCPK